jgi:hypothetical protein
MDLSCDMTKKEIFDTVVRLVEADSDSAQLLVIEKTIPLAYHYLMDYCGVEVAPSHLLIQMVLEDYSKIRSAGLTKKSISSLSEEYLPDYSQKVKNMLEKIRVRKLRSL